MELGLGLGVNTGVGVGVGVTRGMGDDLGVGTGVTRGLGVGLGGVGLGEVVVAAAIFSPDALVSGITAKPSGTALRKNTLVLDSYAVNADSGEAISMNLESGVVAAKVPVPFEIATGPRAVTTPLSSTA